MVSLSFWTAVGSYRWMDHHHSVCRRPWHDVLASSRKRVMPILLRVSSIRSLSTGTMMNKKVAQIALVGFVVGALIPLFWGILGFLLFNVPEGWFSRAYWNAVYITCPFWRISGEKALVLMPLLNGCMYAIIALAIAKATRSPSVTNRPSGGDIANQ